MGEIEPETDDDVDVIDAHLCFVHHTGDAIQYFDEPHVEIVDEDELDDRMHISATYAAHIIDILDVTLQNFVDEIEPHDIADLILVDGILDIEEDDDEVDIEYAIEVIDEFEVMEMKETDEIDEGDDSVGIEVVTDETDDIEIPDRVRENDDVEEIAIIEMHEIDERHEEHMTDEVIAIDAHDKQGIDETHISVIEETDEMIITEAIVRLNHEIDDVLCSVIEENDETENKMLHVDEITEVMVEAFLDECIDWLFFENHSIITVL